VYLLHACAVRLGHVGRYADSLRIADQLAAAFRQLTGDQARDCKPMMAEALNTVGLAHNAQGHADQALAALREAMAIWQELGLDDADSKDELATLHTNLGVILASMGRFDEALAQTEEGIWLLRVLAELDPRRISARLRRCAEQSFGVSG
jgi:tetratricopeptide (TPR) repeat protein